MKRPDRERRDIERAFRLLSTPYPEARIRFACRHEAWVMVPVGRRLRTEPLKGDMAWCGQCRAPKLVVWVG